MSNISQWDNAAGNNNDSPPDGWPEGQAPSTVNDCARELMAAVSRWYDDTKGELVTAGSSNTYTLTTNSTHAALADQSILAFRADRANTGAATLNVDSLGAKSLRMNGAALGSGYLVADAIYVAVYNATDDAYDIANGLTPAQISTALSLGTIATQAANSVAITGGSITGITDLAVADGGTGSSTAADAAEALGVGVTDAPQFSGVNVGNASDTTIARVAAGKISVAGKGILSHAGAYTNAQVTFNTAAASGAADNGAIWFQHEA